MVVLASPGNDSYVIRHETSQIERRCNENNDGGRHKVYRFSKHKVLRKDMGVCHNACRITYLVFSVTINDLRKKLNLLTFNFDFSLKS